MPAHADTLVATRTLRAQAIIAPGDLTLVAADLPGGLSDPALVIGQEARISIYAGRPVRAEDVGPPTVIDRNQIVALSYASGPLAILTEGRALARGGVGDVIRVMNLASRTTVSGRIQPDGSVAVGVSK
jgi:flagella basal body P-ring formation protein FlgA